MISMTTFPALRLGWLARGLNFRSSPRPFPARRRWACAYAYATRHALAAPGAGVAKAGSLVQQLLASGRLNKTALGKLAVAVLREECILAGLPADGTKPVLVERLLQWAAGQGSGGAGEGAAVAVEEEAAAADEAEQQPEQQQQPSSVGTALQPALAAQQEVPQRSFASPGGGGASASASANGSASVDVSLTFLGTSSGNPTSRRNVSSIALHFGEELMVVDVGEGSRNQLRRAGLDVARVRRIFITHLHGDHCFGLCGLLAEICQARLGTFQQHDPVLVYGPPELHSLVAGTFRLASLALTTPVVVTGWVMDPARAHPPRAVDTGGMLTLALAAPDQARPGGALVPERAAQWQEEYDLGSDQVVHPGLTWTVAAPGGVRVVAAQLQHRIPCWGYVFQEPSQLLPPPPGAGPDAGADASTDAGSGEGAEQQVAVRAKGAAAQQEGQQEGRQQWVRRGRKLVVLGDTCDSRAIAAAARNCDVVSHEATFMRGMERKAEVATHSTSEQAGAFARQINAKSLILTHFSARYGLGLREPHGMGKGRSGGATRRGGGRGGHEGKGEQGEQGEQDLDEGHLQCIVAEAQRTFGSDRVFLASDYFTFKVFPHPPQPLVLPGSTPTRDGAEPEHDDSDGSELKRRRPLQPVAWRAQQGSSRGTPGRCAPRDLSQPLRCQEGPSAGVPQGWQQQQEQHLRSQQRPRPGAHQWEGAPTGRGQAAAVPQRQAAQ